jgi:hypothetical protein
MSLPVVPFRFQALHFCWAALHPAPKGIIVFIGGAFFGSFPTFFYRGFLRSLHEQGYTIVALPFRFSFRHWDIALSLVTYQDEFNNELLGEARRLGYRDEIYRENPRSKEFNYAWMGHSLGCKYISLLEILSDLESDSLRSELGDCIGAKQATLLFSSLQTTSLEKNTLMNQPSILLDPVLSDLDNAVPSRVLQRLLSRWIKVRPSREENFCIIGKSKLFNLSALVSFGSLLSRQTIGGLLASIGHRLVVSRVLDLISHLAILGWKSANPAIVKAAIESIDRLASIQTSKD